MSKSLKVSATLNHDRLAVIRKGHANISDLQKFIPASRNRAKDEYDEICKEILLRDGKSVGWWGIEIERVLKHYNMTEQDIRRWAKDESVEKTQVQGQA